MHNRIQKTLSDGIVAGTQTKPLVWTMPAAWSHLEHASQSFIGVLFGPSSTMFYCRLSSVLSSAEFLSFSLVFFSLVLSLFGSAGALPVRAGSVACPPSSWSYCAQL